MRRLTDADARATRANPKHIYIMTTQCDRRRENERESERNKNMHEEEDSLIALDALRLAPRLLQENE